MPVKNKTINRNPLFQIGELVVVKSYPLNNPITGDPLSLPPIMVVCGIEIENKKKKTHDNNHGQQIAEFVKYKLVWFDAKKSNFIEKIMYESFLMKYKFKDKLTNIEYKFSEIAIFKTFSFEINKKKESKSTRSNNVIAGDKKNDTVETTTITSIVPFASPNFVMTGLKINEEKDKFDDKGNATKIVPKHFIKIMWYNTQLQKYSEYELAENCLVKI